MRMTEPSEQEAMSRAPCTDSKLELVMSSVLHALAHLQHVVDILANVPH